MSFIKKHYEKILLGAVLLGLVASLLLLPFIIAGEKKALEDEESQIVDRTPKALAPVDMSAENDALTRVESAYSLDFERTNRLFNPVKWERGPDMQWIKIETGNEVGPGAVKVLAVRPLYFMLKLDRIEPPNTYSPARYVISIQRENAPPAQRNARQRFISVGEKNEYFALTSVTGPANNPQLTLQLADTGDTINLSMKQPFRKVDGYAADLKYPPTGRIWNDQRVGSELKIDNDSYNVVVIDTGEVVLSAESNQKKTTLQYQP